MKKTFILILICSLFLITWCEELCDNSITNITEYIWDWICVWKWTLWEIKWYANCKTSDGWTYSWDIWWHTFHWKWKIITSDWEIQDWYFYNWNFVAWKFTNKNGDSYKWLWKSRNDGSIVIELWKGYHGWVTEYWDFDNNWSISFWVRYYNSVDWYLIWDIWKNSNLYFVYKDWCASINNWSVKEITRAGSYGNIWFESGLSRLSQPWSIMNPYRVNVTIK